MLSGDGVREELKNKPVLGCLVKMLSLTFGVDVVVVDVKSRPGILMSGNFVSGLKNGGLEIFLPVPVMLTGRP